MIFFIFRLFSKLKNIFLCELPEPYIEAQPEMFIPKTSKYLSSCDGTEVLEDGGSLIGMPGNNRFSMEFSVNFISTFAKPSFSIPYCYSLSTIKVILKRFSKKVFDVREGEERCSHRPLDITLPNETMELHGFRLFVANKLIEGNFLKLQDGGLLISIFTCSVQQILNVKQLRDAIKRFKDLLRIRTSVDPRNFAFQFCVEIPTSSTFLHYGVGYKQVYTHFFEILADDYNLKVELNQVNPRDYHLN